MSNLIHVANVLYLFSYLVRDILWLRILTVIAIVCLMPYFYLQPEPLYAAMAWNVLFATINTYQVYRLLQERRPVQLSRDEQALHSIALTYLAPRQLQQLARVGSWKNADEGEVLVEENVILNRIMILLEGAADIVVGEKAVAKLHPGQMIGEMSFLTGSTTAATVIARDEARVIVWERQPLEHFLEAHPQIQGALQTFIGVDLVGKLKHAD